MEKLDRLSFLTKFFQNKKGLQKHHCKWAISEHSKGWSPPGFDRDHVRLVVIVQRHSAICQGGRVLFDSKSENSRGACKNQDGKKKFFSKNKGRPPVCKDSSCSDNCKMGREKRARLASDVKVLEDMMFGTVPLKQNMQKGSSLKVHSIKSPPQLMVTKVFRPDPADKEEAIEQESFDLYSTYSIQSNSAESTPRQIFTPPSEKTSMSLAQSIPVDVPLAQKRSSEENDDSGFSASMASSCSSSMTTSGYSPSTSASLNSVNSLTRRLMRSHTTSFEYGMSKRFSDDSLEPAKRQSCSLGIGITFSLPDEDTETFRKFESFFFSHITLIESHVIKLRVAVEKALVKHNKHMLLEALDVFRSAVYDLYTAPRLSEPVWLSMMSCYTRRIPMCQAFLKEFMAVFEKYDTKATHFFVSTLVTAVLTHHLAWVPTVTPAGATPSRTYLDKHSAKWVDALAKTHPYNPLWAQLGDLYGAIGFPLQMSRTVVTGQRADLVCKLLRILSYFIRCSEVYENTEHRENIDFIDGHIDIPGSTGIAMDTIDEDGISMDAESCGRRYGSATSYGTVRYTAMQTSTETVLSSRSDGTFTDRLVDIRQGRSRSFDSVDRCVASPGKVSYTEEFVSECHHEEDLARDSVEVCPKCHVVSSGCLGFANGSMGRSVFYCCQDVLEKSREGLCNFDLSWEENNGSSLPQEVEEDQDSPHPTPTEEDQNHFTDGNQPEEDCQVDIIETVERKPLLLFRVMSSDTQSEFLSSNYTTSFCDKTSAETDNNSVMPLYVAADNEQTELFQTGSSIESATESNVEADREEQVDLRPEEDKEDNGDEGSPCCRLSQEVVVETQARVETTRHVGRQSDPLYESPFQDIIQPPADKPQAETTICDETNKPRISRVQLSRDQSSNTAAAHSSEESESRTLPEIASDSTVEPLVSPPHHTLPQDLSCASSSDSSSCSEDISPPLRSSQSSLSSLQHKPLGGLEDISPPLRSSRSSLGSVQHKPFSQTKSSSSLYPSLLDLLPSDQPTYQDPLRAVDPDQEVEDPGAVRLIQQDLGLLYPIISGNTVIASKGLQSIDVVTMVTEHVDVEDVVWKSENIAAEEPESKKTVPKKEQRDCSKGDDIYNNCEEYCLETEKEQESQDGNSGHDSSVEECIVQYTVPEKCTPLVISELQTRDSTVLHKVEAWLGSNSSSLKDLNNTKSCDEDAAESDVIDKSTTKEAQSPIIVNCVSVQTKAFFRGNSQFDEYFTEDTENLLPDPSTLDSASVTKVTTPGHTHRSLSHDSDNSVFLPDPPSLEPLSLQGQTPLQEEETWSNQRMSASGPLDMMDEYFMDEHQTVLLPDGPSKDMVTSALCLMQESQEDEDVRSRSDSGGSVLAASSLYDRQLSGGSIVSKHSGGPARCRPITPTELNRRRNGSSTSNISWELDNSGSISNIKETAMPKMTADTSSDSSGPCTFGENFGHSLLAGYTDHYMSDFVLHGTSDNNFLPKLHTDLSISVQNSPLDEQVSEACCIVADTDKWVVRRHTCQVGSADRIKPPLELSSSQLVSSLLESVHRLWKLKMSPEFCLMHLEDRLQEIYFKGKMLAEYIRIHHKIDLKELYTVLGIDISDVPLLLAVAGTHSQKLALGLMH